MILLTQVGQSTRWSHLHYVIMWFVIMRLFVQGNLKEGVK